MLQRHFWTKKSTEVNWPSGGVHFDFRTLVVSKMSFLRCEKCLLCYGKKLSVGRGEGLV